jgi:hypothetical protein
MTTGGGDLGKPSNSTRQDKCRGVWVPAFAGTTLSLLKCMKSYTRSNACRSIFPVPVFGNSSMNFTSRGYL